MFYPKLFLEVATFCCTFIFFMFHLLNKMKLKEVNVNPDEYKQQVRDMKLNDILNNTHKCTESSIRRIIKSRFNKRLLIPNCGWISFISLCLFIILTYLEIHRII
jgi:hypothetical protein